MRWKSDPGRQAAWHFAQYPPSPDQGIRSGGGTSILTLPEESASQGRQPAACASHADRQARRWGDRRGETREQACTVTAQVCQRNYFHYHGCPKGRMTTACRNT